MIQTLFASAEQEPTLLQKLMSGLRKTGAGLVSRIDSSELRGLIRECLLDTFRQSPARATLN